jgi:tRNA1Val (adenine37-N6)-methyltransferase
MRNKSHFKFKKFTVTHAGSTMKVGTDAVLLGAWVTVGQAETILDIGTGNGTIALMLAQRSLETATIAAVELEATDVMQTKENFNSSPWYDKILLHHTSIQNFFPEEKYDLIVSNPPYFNNSQRPPDTRRHQARHTVTLSYRELIDAALRLLKNNGTFNVILPFTEGLQFIELAGSDGLFCTRQYSFRTRSEKPIERWLLEFSTHQTNTEMGEILLYDEGEKWSEGYKKLTADFYLGIWALQCEII